MTANNSITIMRLRDNKKKMFAGFWNIKEDDSTAKLTPIGVEYVNKSNYIYGLVLDNEHQYYWLSMNFKGKKKIIPNSSLCKDGKLHTNYSH